MLPGTLLVFTLLYFCGFKGNKQLYIGACSLCVNIAMRSCLFSVFWCVLILVEIIIIINVIVLSYYTYIRVGYHCYYMTPRISVNNNDYPTSVVGYNLLISQRTIPISA